jgi:two-component system OmpR family sensor kinase
VAFLIRGAVMSSIHGEHQADHKQERLLVVLERLLRIDATELKLTLNQAAQLVVEAFEAEKVDFFLHDPSIDTLVALGTSDTPVGRRQHALGLDQMPIVNGGYMVEVFLTLVAHRC